MTQLHDEGAREGWRAWAGHQASIAGLQGRGAKVILALLACGWLLSGLYNVNPDEQGIVVRLGRWVDTTQPGLHYHLPWPIESVMLPRITQINQLELNTQSISSDAGGEQIPPKQMLTGDENIVEVNCTVFWRIGNAGSFLFNAKQPETALRLAAESALRDVVARTPIQSTMSNRRQQVADETRALLQRWLDEEKSGIVVTQVQLQRVDPPSEVIDAFNDVQRARADQERMRNEAQAYSNDILPKARGEADRIVQDAYAYQAQVVNLAEGQATRFTAIDKTYLQAKDVTAWRLYLDNVDALLKGAGKVVVVDSGSRAVPGVMPYLNLPTSKDKPAAAGGTSR